MSTVITRIEGRELRTKKRVDGWAGWTPVSETEKAKSSKNLRCAHTVTKTMLLHVIRRREKGLALLHEKAGERCCRGQSHHDLVKDQEQMLCT